MKKLISFSLMSLSFLVCQSGFAHTTIADQGSEGTRLRTFVNIPHGCGFETKGESLGVEAMSVLFPNAPDSVATRDDTDEPIPLSEVMDGANDHNGGLVVMSPRVVQDFNVFQKITPIRDANDNVHGIHYEDGHLDPGMVGYAPFQAVLGSFVSTSCATKITAYVPIVNYCHDRTGVRRADAWIGVLTPLFNDPNIVSVGFWPRLVINRELESNPLDASCGEGYGVTLAPSAEDIDETLLIDGYQP